MAFPILPNSTNFLGVALVINRNKDGPKFVFHYPTHIIPVENRLNDADNEDDAFNEDNVLLEKAAGPTDGLTPYNLNVSDFIPWDQDDHIITESGTQIVPWENVAGFPTKDLESILTPARAYHKTLFQISLDPLHFASYPIHKPEKGIWKKRNRKKQGRQAKQQANEDCYQGREEYLLSADDGDHCDAENDAEADAETEANADADADDDAGDGDGQRTDESFGVENGEMADKIAPEKQSAAPEDTEDKISSMTMFNLVFILNPKKYEAKELIDSMYTNIIRKVNKVYKYVQQRRDFVWKESKKILLLKDRAREDRMKMSQLWEEILQNSSLAASMQDLYEAISRNKIAALQLETGEGTITHSVHIPVPFHIADLPILDREEDSRGLWLTTANSSVGENDAIDEPYLDKNFALLLMDDDKKIISELSADPDETTLSMIEFVRHSRPTMSFHQVAQQTNNILTLGQVRKYAQHFIFWRRAIAIPPLHARDIYLFSPNADVRRLPRASATWARQFPFAPALPNFLSDLSVAPRPYKWYCPSKSFRPQYLAMLAWLLRGGWVSQLCTFAYVVVWPEIIYEVEYVLEAEEIARAKKLQVAAIDHLDRGSPDKDDSAATRGRKRRSSGNSALANSMETLTASVSTLQRTASPAGLDRSIGDLSAVSLNDDANATVASREGILSPSQSSPGSISDTADPTLPTSHPQLQPTLAEQVAEKARLERIADKAARELAEKARAHARKAVPKATKHPSVNAAAHLAGLSPYVILEARKATGKESLYLSAIGKRLRERRTENPPSSSSNKKESAATRGKRPAGSSMKAGEGKSRMKSGGGESTVGWDQRVANAWPSFWKYFNGRSPLERIALQEEMKRKDAWNLLTAMSEFLLCVRHW